MGTAVDYQSVPLGQVRLRVLEVLSDVAVDFVRRNNPYSVHHRGDVDRDQLLDVRIVDLRPDVDLVRQGLSREDALRV